MSTRVVVVDDADDVRLLVRLALESTNRYEVVGLGASGRDAVDLARRHHPDVMLLDVSMTDMDGFAALPLVLEESPASRVVMLSGFDAAGVAETALRLGAAGYVQKSGNIRELPRRLAEVLGTPVPAKVALDLRDGVDADIAGAEELLADQVERFRDVFQQGAIGMAIVTLGLRIVRANPALGDLVGCDPSELTGRDFLSLLEPHDATRARDEIATILASASRPPLQMELRLPGTGGGRWVQATAGVVADRAGTPLYLFVQLQDITARRDAEHERELLRTLSIDVATAPTVDDAFRAVLARICEAAEWSHGAVWVKDEGGVLVHGPAWTGRGRSLAAFAAASRLVTFAPGEGLIGRVWASGEPAWVENIATEPGFVRRVSAVGAGLRSALVVPVRADDEVVAVLEFYVPQPRPEERAHIAIVGAAATELGAVVKRRQAEDAQQQTAALLARAEAVARLGSWRWDLRTDTMRWSDELFRLLGHEPQSFTPTFDAFATHVHPDDRERLRDGMEAARTTGAMATAAFRVIRGDCVVRTLEGAGEAVANAGRPVAVVGTLQDITERAEAEHELRARTAEVERSNDELRRFAELAASGLGHPLDQLAGFAQALGERYQGDLDEPMAHLVEAIGTNASNMRQLVDDLLAYAAAGAPGDPAALTADVDLAAVAADVVEGLAPQLASCGARVGIAPLPTVAGNAAQLATVLRELVMNALVHVPAGTVPTVRIAASEGDGEVEISVADNGCGVAERDRARIFDLFERAGDAEGTGTGVGLSICRRIVERHGGRIWVEPGASGGSRFCFTLPIRTTATTA